MTPDILIFLAILAVMVSLFLFSRLPYDMTALAALLVMYSLGYLDSAQIFSGFSSPAIVIYISTFFIAGALKRTGVATAMAEKIADWVGVGEKKNVTAVMLVGGFGFCLYE